MSSDSLALFRRNPSADLQKLADEHLQHDLTPNDRALLKSASTTLSTHVFLGSLLGLSFGALLSLRLRTSRRKWFDAFKTSQKPTSLKFADGREEAIPDITELVKPTPLGDLATYTFFSIAGIFLGGESGVLTGAWRARSTINGDGEARERIERAFRGFRVDVLKKEIEELEKGRTTGGFLV